MKVTLQLPCGVMMVLYGVRCATAAARYLIYPRTRRSGIINASEAGNLARALHSSTWNAGSAVGQEAVFIQSSQWAGTRRWDGVGDAVYTRSEAPGRLLGTASGRRGSRQKRAKVRIKGRDGSSHGAGYKCSIVTVRRLAQAFVRSVTDEAGEGGRCSVVCWRVANSQAYPSSARFSMGRRNAANRRRQRSVRLQP